MPLTFDLRPATPVRPRFLLADLPRRHEASDRGLRPHLARGERSASSSSRRLADAGTSILRPAGARSAGWLQRRGDRATIRGSSRQLFAADGGCATAASARSFLSWMKERADRKRKDLTLDGA